MGNHCSPCNRPPLKWVSTHWLQRRTLLASSTDWQSSLNLFAFFPVRTTPNKWISFVSVCVSRAAKTLLLTSVMFSVSSSIVILLKSKFTPGSVSLPSTPDAELCGEIDCDDMGDAFDTPGEGEKLGRDCDAV